jgi:hypothetical protein
MRSLSQGVLLALVAVWTIWVPGKAAGQTVDTVRVEITRIQARGVYTTVADGISWASGDTLQVVSTTGIRTTVRLVGRSTSSLLLAWVGDALAVEVGDVLTLVGRRGRTTPVDAERTPAVADRVSILDREGRTGRAGARGRSGPRVDGRLMVGVSGLQSTTRGRMTDNVSVSRSFLTPSTALRLRVGRLPGDVELDLNARYSRRFSSNDIIGQADAPRIYDLSISQPVGHTGVRYAAGRFNDSRLAQSGYWDGVRMEHDVGSFEWGLAGGFEPDRYNQGFRSDRPKFAAYAGGMRRFDGGSFSLTGAFTQLRPTNDWLDHSFFSVDQELRIRGVRVTNRLLLDRDPESGSWIPSRYQARAGIPVSSSLRLTARYSMRQPYGYWRTTDIFSDRRDQISAGISYARNQTRLSLTGTENRIEHSDPSRTATGHFSTEPRWMPFRTSGTLSAWFRHSSRTLYGTLGLHRTLLGSDMALNLTTYNIQTVGPSATSLMAGVSIRIPLHENGSLSIRTRSQFLGEITSNQLYVTYWVAF